MGMLASEEAQEIKAYAEKQWPPLPGKRDINEVLSLRHPPRGVSQIMNAAACLLVDGFRPPTGEVWSEEDSSDTWQKVVPVFRESLREEWEAMSSMGIWNRFRDISDKQKWDYIEAVLAHPSASSDELHRKSLAAGLFRDILEAATEIMGKHRAQVSQDQLEMLAASEKKIPILQAVIAIKTSPTLAALRTCKNEVPWGRLKKSATVEDLEALKMIARNKRISAKAAKQVADIIAELEREAGWKST